MQPQRRIPYHIRKDVSKELKKLEEQDIVEKVANQPTPWISPIVDTQKKDGGTRICVEMREANQAIERERHTMPKLQDFKAEVNGAKFFSKIDLKQAYHQLELHPQSRLRFLLQRFLRTKDCYRTSKTSAISEESKTLSMTL